ncbi:MAG: hypothetical protein IH948_08430 [Bacteroidetes bacterium]|nr:hypothetical protein [Bacteroidota bacterium]
MKRPLFIPLFLLVALSLNNCTTSQRITFAQRAPKSYTMRTEGLDQVIEFSDGTTYRAGLIPYTIFTTIEESILTENQLRKLYKTETLRAGLKILDQNNDYKISRSEINDAMTDQTISSRLIDLLDD